MQFLESLEQTRLAKKEAQRLELELQEKLARQYITPPNSQPTQQEEEEQLCIEQLRIEQLRIEQQEEEEPPSRRRFPRGPKKSPRAK